MNGEDYRSKYLKYKQKYTNALQNMQGGASISEALQKQPKKVFVVDADTNNKLNTLLGGTEKKITQSDCVDSLVGISNKDVIRIIPMTKYKYKKTELKRSEGTTDTLFRGIERSSETIFKDGLQKINGEPAPEKANTALPFDGFTFGELSSRYNSGTALNHLKSEYGYFTNQCGIRNPYIVVFGGDNTLCLCGPLTN